MANLNGFDANQVEPHAALEPLPAGVYVACVSASEMRPTAQGDGSYLNLELTIVEGQYKGRKVWDRLCLNHPKPEAVRFARARLSSLCRAVQVLQPRDSTQLHNLPLTLKLGLKKRNDTHEMANEVRGYESKSTAHGVPQQVVPTSGNTPPWKR